MGEVIKPLTIAKSMHMAKVNRNHCLYNETDDTYIKIPPKVIKCLEKMDNSERGGLAADSLAMSIALRRKSDITQAMKYWLDSYSKPNYYPQCQANKIFSKYLETVLLSPLMDGLFNEEDVRELVHFFAKCPHGYKFYNEFIAVHSELSPIIT